MPFSLYVISGFLTLLALAVGYQVWVNQQGEADDPHSSTESSHDVGAYGKYSNTF